MLSQLRDAKNRLLFQSLFCVFCAFGIAIIPCFASVVDTIQLLPDDYLQREFSWALVVYQPDKSHYLKYPGSKLWPVTNLRVDLRTYPRDRTVPLTTCYEDLWYHDSLPIGLRRQNEIAIAEQSIGAIIVCQANDTSRAAERTQEVTDAVVRLLVDAQFRKAVTGLILVPACEYDSIASALSQFNFFPAGPRVQVGPVNLHLRAYPEGGDAFFYFQK